MVRQESSADLRCPLAPALVRPCALWCADVPLWFLLLRAAQFKSESARSLTEFREFKFTSGSSRRGGSKFNAATAAKIAAAAQQPAAANKSTKNKENAGPNVAAAPAAKRTKTVAEVRGGANTKRPASKACDSRGRAAVADVSPSAIRAFEFRSMFVSLSRVCSARSRPPLA